MSTVKGLYSKVFDGEEVVNDAGEKTKEFAHVQEVVFLIAVNKRVLRELQAYAVRQFREQLDAWHAEEVKRIEGMVGGGDRELTV